MTVLMMLAAAACSPLLPAPPAAAVLATATPDLIGTALAETLTAIPTPSFTLLPPSRTPTVTKTQFPTITPIPSDSPIPSNTPKGAGPTSTATGEGTPGGNYACQVVTKSPQDWKTFKPRAYFDAHWTISNKGLRTWRVGQVVLTYISGAKLFQKKTYPYPLPDDLKPGDDPFVLIVDMVAPKAPGYYDSVWGLVDVKTEIVFCTFTIKIIVQ